MRGILIQLAKDAAESVAERFPSGGSNCGAGRSGVVLDQALGAETGG
jgi:hypothetical protein